MDDIDLEAARDRHFQAEAFGTVKIPALQKNERNLGLKNKNKLYARCQQASCLLVFGDLFIFCMNVCV